MKLITFSLPNKVTLSILALIFFGLGPLVIYTTNTLKSNLQSLLTSQQVSSLNFVADSVEQKISLRTEALQDVASHLPVDNINDSFKVSAYLENRLAIYRLFTNGVVVIGKNGIGITDYPHVSNRGTGDFRELEYFKEVMATGNTAIGKPRIGRFTKKMGIGIAVPIKDKNDHIVGVFVGFMSLNDGGIFNETQTNSGKNGEYVIVSVIDRTIIMDTDNIHTLMPINVLGKDPEFEHLIAAKNGTIIANSIHGGESLTSAKLILNGRWLVLRTLPVEVAFAPIRLLKNQIFKVSASVLIIITALIWWLMNYQLKPIVEATQLIDQMASTKDRLSQIPVNSDDEVGLLFKSFNKLQNDLQSSYLELEKKAHIDFLTGLFNRRYFIELAEKEVNRSIRYGSSLALFMMDIDNFKRVNDTYGHEVGDIVLKRLSTLLEETLRNIDISGRIGGEEFAILLPETDRNNAVDIAERIRKSIENTLIILDHGPSLTFTASIGIAVSNGKETNLDILMSIADKALYKAKNSGRNKVWID